MRKAMWPQEVLIDGGWNTNEPLFTWFFVYCHGSHGDWSAVLIPEDFSVLNGGKHLALEALLYDESPFVWIALHPTLA